MFIEKLNAIELHKFIKENLDETVVSVDIRPALSKKAGNKKVAKIYNQTKSGKELNFVIYDDTNFCISTSNFNNSNKIKSLTPKNINLLWRKFMYQKFGEEYFKHTIKKDENIVIL